MFLKRSPCQPETCRICGLEPKNSARASALRNAWPTSHAVEIPVKSFVPEPVGSKWFAPVRTTRATGPDDWLKISLPLRVEVAPPHGASESLLPHRISDGLPEMSRPFEVAVNVLSSWTGIVESTRESRAALTVPLPPCE